MSSRARHDTPPLPTQSQAAGESDRTRTLESAPIDPSPESGRYPSTRQETAAELLPQDDAARLGARWDVIQSSFVDDPRTAVAQADELVGQVVERVITQFAQQRAALERQWDRGDQVTTEDLRVALQRYREFFQRLLSLENGVQQ
jgi:hypothetical protein